MRSALFSVLAGFGALTLPAFSALAQAGPSYDCARASRGDEVLICETPHLAVKDRELALVYGDLRTFLSDTGDAERLETIRNAQRLWVRVRASRCGIDGASLDDENRRSAAVACLAAAYSDRIAMLKALQHDAGMVPSPPSSANAPADAASETAAAPADPPRVVERTIETNDAEKHTEVAMAYPAITWPENAGTKAFNDMILSLLAGWQRDLLAAEGGTEETSQFLGVGYEVMLATPRLVSVRFEASWYGPHAARADTMSHALTFDLQNGRSLMLDDVFQGDAWRNDLAETVIADLEDQAAEEGWELNGMQEQTVPIVLGDVSRWNFDESGAVVTFNAYQVSSYPGDSIPVRISWETLAPYMASTGPLAALADAD